MATVGFNTLSGSTRVRTSTYGLVKLEDLSGSGPAGPIGPAGPAGPAGTVDYSNLYTKAEVDASLLFKENLLQTGTHPGANIWDSALRQLRIVLGQNGIQTLIFQHQQDPNDPNNGSLIVDGSALQGGSSVGIPTAVAEFTATNIYLKKDVLAQANRTVSYHLAANTALANSLDCALLTTSSGAGIEMEDHNDALLLKLTSSSVQTHKPPWKPFTRYL